MLILFSMDLQGGGAKGCGGFRFWGFRRVFCQSESQPAFNQLNSIWLPRGCLLRPRRPRPHLRAPRKPTTTHCDYQTCAHLSIPIFSISTEPIHSNDFFPANPENNGRTYLGEPDRDCVPTFYYPRARGGLALGCSGFAPWPWVLTPLGSTTPILRSCTWGRAMGKGGGGGRTVLVPFSRSCAAG